MVLIAELHRLDELMWNMTVEGIRGTQAAKIIQMQNLAFAENADGFLGKGAMAVGKIADRCHRAIVERQCDRAIVADFGTGAARTGMYAGYR